MDGWPEGQVRKISRVWTDPTDGHAWLAVFDLAMLGGRVECVGAALRSSVPPGEDEDIDPWLLWEWVDPGPKRGAEVEAVELRHLKADTLRNFPLVTILGLAREDLWGELQDIADEILEHPVPLPYMTPEDEAASVRSMAAVYGRGQARAPRIKTTQKLLERVADVYQRAWREGEESPSKAVEQALQVSPDQARKLVSRCRKTDPPLLPPTERRKARGWLPGERDEGTER
jgi:hypothetical protein